MSKDLLGNSQSSEALEAAEPKHPFMRKCGEWALNGAGIGFIGLIVVGLPYAVIEQAISDRHASEHFQSAVKPAIRHDGFDGSSHVSSTSRTIGELMLGKCTFHNVSFTFKGSEPNDVTGYKMTINSYDTQDGKYVNNHEIIDIHFSNATELQQELPNLNCLA